MKIIHTSVEEMAMRRLLIGFEGENQRATVRIDCASVFAEYPNATPALIVKPLFADAYPVVVDRNGTNVDWLITSEILSFTGDGEIQLTFYKDAVICKSAITKIVVCRSLQVTGDMPDPVVQWIDDANRKLAEVDAQIVELEEMVDTATDAATRAEHSASTASTKAEQAAGSAATATAKATEATNAAGTATAKAAEAQLQAQYAINSAQSAAESERVATAKAGEATTAAGTATTKATEATEAARTATEKAADASASATAAQTSATNAASSATAAQASQTAAKASETAASTSATQAGTSAQNAGTAAQTATQKAAEATQSATNAETFAGTATTKAEEAAASAQAASDAQTAVEQTAEQLADSLEQIDQNTADIAELDDRKANVDGYYPDMTVGNAEQLNSSKYVENSEPYIFRQSGGTSDIGNREYLDAVVGGTLAWNQAVRDEASENSTDFADIVTVTDAVEDAAGVNVKIEPVQDLHGYDHPWPAGGGKNIVDFGTISPATTNYAFQFSTPIPAGSYVLSFDVAGLSWSNSTDAAMSWIRYDSGTADMVFSSVKRVSDNASLKDLAQPVTGRFYVAVTSNAEGQYLIIAFRSNSYKMFTSGTMSNIMLESGTAPTDFTPYSNICPITGWAAAQIVVSPTTDAADGQTYSITLPSEAGTVYGGELTVNADGSGSLVVDRAKKILNGTEPYGTSTYASNENYAHIVLSDMNYSKQNQSAIMCDKLSMNGSAPYSNSGVGVWQGGSNVWYICVKKELLESDNSAGMISWIASNRPEAVYYLAQPQTYSISASEIRTLLGTNNVWADTGDLALTYTGTDEHLTLESGKKYLTRISGTDSMLLGSGQEITAAKGTDNVFDLTKMFGTAVADYVYGQGAAFFRKWFPNAVYPYNAGELKHVEGLSAHEMVGFNAWDEEWELGSIKTQDGKNTSSTQKIRSKNFIPCIPSTRYGIYYSNYGADVDYVYFYDSDQQFIGYKIYRTNNDGTTGTYIFETLENCRYIRFIIKATSYHGGLCVHLAHNGSRNGEYEPYEKHSYPLDSTVVLRGIPKVGANGVYWDGDRYLPDGTVERRYGMVDLGTLSWTRYADGANPIYYANLPDKTKNPATSNEVDAVACGYLWRPSVSNANTASLTLGDKEFCGFSAVSDHRSFLYFRNDAYTTEAAFREAVSGVYLVYELATPTTETAQPYHSTQWVSDWGTEEFVSTGIVPVGHETRYPANLRDKLQHLPDAASGNGSYLITQTDGQMVLTPFPAPPSTAGNYVLKATVTNGVATYTWEVAT